MSRSIENVVQDIRHSGRSFLKAPLAALTIVATIGVGLGLVAAVYTILNTMIFSVDAVSNPQQLFAVERQQSAFGEQATFAFDEYETMLRETDMFADAFATTGDVDSWIEGVRREGHLVTGNFFQVLGVTAALGRAFAPPDDEAGTPPVIVLSHRAWVQHFDADPAVLERSYRVNGSTFEVIGVMPEDFRGLEIIAAPDFWAPLAHLDLFSGRGMGEGAISSREIKITGRLRDGLTQGQAVAELNAWDQQRFANQAAERPPSLVLAPNLGTVPRAAEAMLGFLPLFFAFGLILMIGCANVANLLLARLMKRQREIGIRLAIGASRARVVRLLLMENLLLALVASVLAFVISRVVLRGAGYVLTSTFPSEIGNLRIAVPEADWRVALMLLAGAIVATMLFALAPALRATRLDVARSMHGEVTQSARPSRARNALVALQVTGSVLLLICAAIFLRSALSWSTIDPGFRTADIVNVSVLDESRRAAILDTVTTEPSVAAVAASWPGSLGGLGGLPAYGEGASGRSVVSFQFVTPTFFDVLDIDVVRGRGFFDDERDPNQPVAIVSESVARELWPGVNPLGQVVRIEPDLSILSPEAGGAGASPPNDPMLQARSAVVVGVARDVAGFQIASVPLGGAGVYLPISPEAAGSALVTRVRGDAGAARRGLVDRLAAIDPNMSEVTSLNTLASANAYLLRMSFWLTLILGSLALIMTLTGLFSVLSYLVEQRTREIGVRMALGANRHSIGRLVLQQSARPVGFGVVFGGILTAGLGAALLSTPVADQIAATVLLFDPMAYAASLAFIVAACAGAALIPALRAGRVNPLVALRQD